MTIPAVYNTEYKNNTNANPPSPLPSRGHLVTLCLLLYEQSNEKTICLHLISPGGYFIPGKPNMNMLWDSLG